jgi:hypothetical protein
VEDEEEATGLVQSLVALEEVLTTTEFQEVQEQLVRETEVVMVGVSEGMPVAVEVEPHPQALTFHPIMWAPKEATVFDSTSEGFMTSQLLEAVARATGERERVAIMVEDREARVAQEPMVLHGAAVAVPVASTTVLASGDTRGVMDFVVRYSLAT